MKSSERALQEFFTALLDEHDPVELKVDAAPLQKLLDGVEQPKLVEPQPKVEQPLVEKLTTAEVKTLAPVEALAEPSATIEDAIENQISIEEASVQDSFSYLTEAPPEPDSEFQALYFEVAGMRLAVPLEQLGGIHNLDEEQVSSLIGKPDWFKGLLPHRERKLNVVDTALWVMPEKYDDKLAEQLNYQYLVMLKDSNWGLACEKLVTTSQLMPTEVNWRTTMGKRPWLRGMVKEQMCALLNVDALIELLDTGMNSQQANNPE